MVVLLHCEVLVPRKTDIDPAYAKIGSSFHRLTLINAKIKIIFTLFGFKKKEVINTENVTKSVKINIAYCRFTKSDHLILTKLSHFPSTLS